ncbi:MAG TPA: metallophosphoesterase [Fimbriimonas sp.]|nr:metallophosphoesterase [Fimbriimonas sp.]
MRIAHLSDTHLGFRAFSRTHPSGLNFREVDVMKTFEAVLQDILLHQPDLVIHSGDLFHVVRPSNNTITQAFRLLNGFQYERRYRPFVLCGGNHDTPKTADMGNIQKLFAGIDGVRFVGNLSERLSIPDLDCEVLCIPSNSLVAREEVALRPMLCHRHSVLTVHGMARQALPKQADAGTADFDVDDLHTDMFTYTALGDYHVHTPYAENCCFSGSTDYTTTNIWEEVGTPKGWVLFDTDRGELQHMAVPCRPAIDLEALDAEALSIDAIHEAMRASAEGLEGLPIVRQRIINVHPSDRARLMNMPLLKELGAKCLNYQIKTTPPTVDKGDGTITPTATGKSLEDLWREHAMGVKCPNGSTTNFLVGCGLELLKEVAEREAA